MPHFCNRCGADEYICQSCGKIFCSKEFPGTWMTPVPGKSFNGNICPNCNKNSKSKEGRKNVNR